MLVSTSVYNNSSKSENTRCMPRWKNGENESKIRFSVETKLISQKFGDSFRNNHGDEEQSHEEV